MYPPPFEINKVDPSFSSVYHSRHTTTSVWIGKNDQFCLDCALEFVADESNFGLRRVKIIQQVREELSRTSSNIVGRKLLAFCLKMLVTTRSGGREDAIGHVLELVFEFMSESLLLESLPHIGRIVGKLVNLVLQDQVYGVCINTFPQ